MFPPPSFFFSLFQTGYPEPRFAHHVEAFCSNFLMWTQNQRTGGAPSVPLWAFYCTFWRAAFGKEPMDHGAGSACRCQHSDMPAPPSSLAIVLILESSLQLSPLLELWSHSPPWMWARRGGDELGSASFAGPACPKTLQTVWNSFCFHASKVQKVVFNIGGGTWLYSPVKSHKHEVTALPGIDRTSAADPVTVPQPCWKSPHRRNTQQHSPRNGFVKS